MVKVDAIELFDVEAIQNPYPLYERMRSAAPAHRIGDSGFYAACTWPAVHEAVARTEDFSSNLVATMRYTRGGRCAIPDGTARGADARARDRRRSRACRTP